MLTASVHTHYRYSSVLDCVRTTFAEEGLPGFFRGVAIPLVTITLVRTTSFAIYTNVRDSLKKRGILADGSLASAQALGFLGGASSGLALSVGTVAFEYTKVAMREFTTLARSSELTHALQSSTT